MANTTNIDLVKPAGTDHALVSVLNANSDKIDAEAGNVRSNFALVQNTNTATQAISKDQLVVWKGVLKKATSNIANGATLSNSNLTDTKVSTELASLSDQIAQLKTNYSIQTVNVTDNVNNVERIQNAVASVTFGGGTNIVNFKNTANDNMIVATLVATAMNNSYVRGLLFGYYSDDIYNIKKASSTITITIV